MNARDFTIVYFTFIVGTLVLARILIGMAL